MTIRVAEKVTLQHLYKRRKSVRKMREMGSASLRFASARLGMTWRWTMTSLGLVEVCLGLQCGL